MSIRLKLSMIASKPVAVDDKIEFAFFFARADAGPA
jgi:hypothetical protein